ncbi:MAG: hypothetical protein Q7S37_01685 [bacterium]|nr:hypothetical protein [bacterium]
MPKKKQVKEEQDNPVVEVEEEALVDSEEDREEEKNLGIDDTDENLQEETQIKKVVGDVAGLPSEVAAINTDNETAREATKKVQGTTNKNKSRSKRYITAVSKVDKNKKYTIDEAIELAKETSSTKFEGSVELHVKLSEKKSKKKGTDELARGILHLPHGMGKELKVIVLDENKIEEIAKTKKVDFDVAIATPALMPKMGKIAKILGPKGKMPNPKTGTVSDDPEKVKEEIKNGKVEYKVDANNVVHQMIGKTSWDSIKLKENFQVVMQALPKNRVQSVALSTTMGPGIKVEY